MVLVLVLTPSFSRVLEGGAAGTEWSSICVRSFVGSSLAGSAFAGLHQHNLKRPTRRKRPYRFHPKHCDDEEFRDMFRFKKEDTYKLHVLWVFQPNLRPSVVTLSRVTSACSCVWSGMLDPRLGCLRSVFERSRA